MSLLSEAPVQPAWGAVLSMSLGVFGIVGAEFLPASLLTAMATDLGVSEGQAGQAVTVTAGVGLISSLLVTVVSGRADRRTVLLLLTLLLVLSNILVAIAPSLGAVLVARVLLGVSLGGFWALSAATMMRLVPEALLPRALAILFGGVTAATVFAAPLGSFLGEVYGWRTAFAGAAGLGVLAFLVQLLCLPSMRADRAARLSTIFAVLLRPRMALGMATFLTVFAGHFGFFTYLRPFLETVTRADAQMVTAVLLIFGFGTFLGNSISSFLISRSLAAVLALLPLMLAAVALLLAQLGGTLVLDATLTGLWGVAFGIIPVSWSTWVTGTVPDEAETGGGVFVATANLAIAIGAGLGGVVVDRFGIEVQYLVCALLLLIGSFGALQLGRKTRSE